MKKFSLLLWVFILVMWPFGIAGHATRNFEQMPGALFGLDHWDCHAWDIELPVPKVEIIADWDTKLNGLWVQVLDNDATYIRAETVPISDSGLLLIFAIGLVLVWVSRFGEKFFKNKKR